MIALFVNGAPYTEFVDASVTLALSTLSNDFTFTASAVNTAPDFREGDAVTVYVDGVLVLTGRIGEVNGSEREGSHAVTYSGRDNTADFFDSQIDVIDEFIPSDALTLRVVLEKVIAHLGLGIKVIDDVQPAAFNRAEDIVRPEVGQGAFAFVQAFARKRQVLLSSTAAGDILITQSRPVATTAVLRRRGGVSNILSQSWSKGGNLLFNRYVRRGQLSPGALDYSAGYDSEDVENQAGAFVEDAVRSGRQQVVVEGESYSSEQLRDRAKWASQLSKAKAIKFSCAVKGHQLAGSTGGLWQPNKLALVDSAAADISRQMLVDVVTFTQGEDAPTVTRLDCVERDVYTIDDKILAQRPVGDLLNDFSNVGAGNG